MDFWMIRSLSPYWYFVLCQSMLRIVLLGASLLTKYFCYSKRNHLSNLDRHMFLYFEYHTIIIIEPIITPNSE
jgi:hypothetical protein